jgi:hypothetical protein
MFNKNGRNLMKKRFLGNAANKFGRAAFSAATYITMP